MARQPGCPWPSSQCDGGCRVCRGEAAPESDGPHRQVSLRQFVTALVGHVAQLPFAARDERMREEGREEMRRRHDILNAEESRALAEILKNPPPPPPALVEAMRHLRLQDESRKTWVKALRWVASCCKTDIEAITYAASVSNLPGASERIFVLRDRMEKLAKRADEIEAGGVLPDEPHLPIPGPPNAPKQKEGSS